MTDALRSDQVERLLRVQRAARAVADSAAGWWRQLGEAADAALTPGTLDSFYRLLLAEMQPVLEADEVSILVADPAEKALVSRTSIGLGENTTVAVRIPAGEGMAGRVLASSEPLIIDDLATFRLVSPTLQDQGLKSVVAVPILAESRVIGVMHAGSRELAHFTAEDAELLGILAERAAITIERVGLLEEQRRIAKLSTFLAETTRIMSGATDLTGAFDELAKAALPAIGDLCLIDTVADNGQIERVVARHQRPAQQPLADRLREEFAPVASSAHPAAEVLQTGRSRWSPSMSDGFLRSTTQSEEHFQITKALGFRSYITVPISSAAKTIGVLTLVSCSRSFTLDDVVLAEALANQVGTVVAKARQLDQESLTSRLLQEALLPNVPDSISGLAVHVSYQPASSSLDVGGDFYDVVPIPDGPVWLTIGDVEGHDQRAAAEMGQLRGAIRTLAIRGLEPQEIVDELAESWEAFGFTKTATVLIGRFDPSTGQVVMASAGHPPPLLISASGADYLPIAPNSILGATRHRSAVSYGLSLAGGEALLFYTDGALRERTYAIDDAMAILRKAASGDDRSPRSICWRITEAAGNSDDDTALLAIQRS